LLDQNHCHLAADPQSFSEPPRLRVQSNRAYYLRLLVGTELRRPKVAAATPGFRATSRASDVWVRVARRGSWVKAQSEYWW
jgi:hypothetical protein